MGYSYSFTQISQYLRCPRSYRYRYLDGWREKETRAAMAFGRCFENALGAYFRDEDCGVALFNEWQAYRDAPFEFKKGETWDRFLHQGVHLLESFARDSPALISHCTAIEKQSCSCVRQSASEMPSVRVRR